MTDNDKAEELAHELTRRLIKEGRLLAGGFAAWVMYHKISPDDPRLPAMLDLYMSGAEHLWTSVMNNLTPGDDSQPADEKMMDNIDKELTTWRKAKSLARVVNMETKGNA